MAVSQDEIRRRIEQTRRTARLGNQNPRTVAASNPGRASTNQRTGRTVPSTNNNNNISNSDLPPALPGQANPPGVAQPNQRNQGGAGGAGGQAATTNPSGTTNPVDGLNQVTPARLGDTAGDPSIQRSVTNNADGTSTATFTGRGIPESGAASVTAPTQSFERPTTGTFSTLQGNFGGGASRQELAAIPSRNQQILAAREQTFNAQADNATRLNRQNLERAQQNSINAQFEQATANIDSRIRDIENSNLSPGRKARAIQNLTGKRADLATSQARLGEQRRANRASEATDNRSLDLRQRDQNLQANTAAARLGQQANQQQFEQNLDEKKLRLERQGASAKQATDRIKAADSLRNLFSANSGLAPGEGTRIAATQFDNVTVARISPEAQSVVQQFRDGGFGRGIEAANALRNELSKQFGLTLNDSQLQQVLR